MAENNIIDLSKIVCTTERRAWVDFKGCQFQVAYVSRTTLGAIADKCMIVGYSPTQKTRSQRRIDPEAFAKELGRAIVKDWRNVTPRTLQGLMLLDTTGMTPEQLDTALPFNEGNLTLVMVNSTGLDDFLQEVAMEPTTFTTGGIPQGETEKNSESGPSGTSTPTT